MVGVFCCAMYSNASVVLQAASERWQHAKRGLHDLCMRAAHHDVLAALMAGGCLLLQVCPVSILMHGIADSGPAGIASSPWPLVTISAHQVPRYCV